MGRIVGRRISAFNSNLCVFVYVCVCVIFPPTRYNPEHLKVIEAYVEDQAKDNKYDLEANLACLKLYQFNPQMMNLDVTYTILLKSLTNFPHTDFVLCKCLLLPAQMNDDSVKEIVYLADILEKCDFTLFWSRVQKNPQFFKKITGFSESIRKFVCHVVGITFQSIEKQYLVRLLGDVDGKLRNGTIFENQIIHFEQSF